MIPPLLQAAVHHGTGRDKLENNRFSLNYIGTQEGVAAYGWGLYFPTNSPGGPGMGEITLMTVGCFEVERSSS